MKYRLSKILTLAFALAFFACAGSAQAAAQDASVQFVQKLGDKALSSLTAKELPAAEREKRVRELLRGYFDVQTIGKFALGTHWKGASEKQRAEYMSLFEDMIVKTYAQRFSEYSGQDFKVGNGIKASERDTVVSSQIIQPDGPPVNVEWRVRSKNGQMKIIDVIVESISMSVTQRSDFSAVIQKGGGNVDALLASLRKRKGEKS